MFQIFQWRSFPQVETAGILRGKNQRQLDAETEAEDTVASDFEDTFAYSEEIMLLATTS